MPAWAPDEGWCDNFAVSVTLWLDQRVWLLARSAFAVGPRRHQIKSGVTKQGAGVVLRLRRHRIKSGVTNQGAGVAM